VCDTLFHFLKWFFSRDLPLRLMGTKLQGRALVAAVKMHETDETMRFFREQSAATVTRMPRAWNRFRQAHYHERIRRIEVTVLLLAGEYDALMACNKVTLRADVDHLGGPAEYVVFSGFYHFMPLEEHRGERGVDLIIAALAAFHKKHFGG